MRIAICAALLASACGTTVEVVGVGPNSPPVMTGVSYALPALSYDVIVTRELVSCDDSDSAPKFEVGAEITPRYGPGETFVLDPSELSSWRKTSKADLSFYGDGVIKSFNGGIVDRTPEIAAAGVSAGFAIARLALGIPSLPVSPKDLGGGGAAQGEPELSFTCPRGRLNEIASHRDNERRMSDEVAAATGKLERLRQAALIGDLSQPDKKAVAELIAKIADLNRRIGEAAAARDAVRAALTLRQETQITPSVSAQSETIGLALDTAPVRRWTATFLTAGTQARGKELPRKELADKLELVAVWSVLPRLAVDGKLCQQAGAGPECGAASIKQDNKGRIEGIAYRDAARVRLRICQATDAATCSSGASKPVAQSGADAAPQLGRLMLLPLRNGFGEDTELTAEFAPDGRLLKAKYDSRKASGELALQVVGGGLNQGEGFVAARAKAQTDARQAEPASLAARIQTAKQQRDLLDAEAALGADKIAQSRRLEDLDREIKLLEAEKKVRELREALGAGSHS